jgi:transglutaminase-like putative cysteine protease
VTALAAGSGYVKVETTDYNYYTVQVNVSEGNVTTDLPKVTSTPIPTSKPEVTATPTNMPTIKPTEVPKATPTATPTPVTTKAPTPTPKLANPYLSPDHATIKINEKYQINLIGTYIMFCYENTWGDVYAEIDPTGVITGKMECKNAVINILGEDGNTYRFYLTVSGYTDPVEDQPELLTEEDIKLNKILYNDTYGILKKSTKKTYTEELYYDVTDRTSLIKAAHDGLEKGAKKIHFRFTDHDADYWESEFRYIREFRGEAGSYTTMYSIEKGTNEIILKPTYKDGWNVVLAMRYKDYEISEKAEKVWREAYKLANEAYKQHPDNVREILSYINKELCDMVEYTYSNTDHDDASGIFLDHKGVCAGYSSAVSLLCNILGIDNMVIFSSDGEHAWNYVKVDGKWYHLDVTFNDSLRSDGAYRNDYFLITDEELVEVSKNYQHPEYHSYEVDALMSQT